MWLKKGWSSPLKQRKFCSVPREPFAPKRIIAHQALLASYLCNLFSSGAVMTLVFHVSLYLQAVRGATARDVGLVMLPLVFGGVTGSLTAGLVMQTTGKYYKLTLSTFMVMLVGCTVTALVTGPVKFTMAGLIFGKNSHAFSL